MKKLQWRQGQVLGLFGWLRLFALVGLLAAATSSAFAAKTYSDNGDGTVTDPTTGLQWMRCAVGQTWDGTTCTGTAGGYTWDQAYALTGTVNFAGQNDWRLPNIRELTTLDQGVSINTQIYTPAFPNIPPSTFWSASAYANNSSSAWNVYFYNGYANRYFFKFYTSQVRLVRAGQSLGLLDIARPNTDYVDPGNGTVTHTPTRLMWQRCAVGQAWTGSTCSGAASTFTWDAAKLLPSTFAGQTDWRLPTEEELLSLVDYSRTSPAINTTLFPNTLTSFFWSASNYLGGNTPWSVNFGNGDAYTYDKGNAFQVRLVRAGPCFGPLVLTVNKTGTGQVTSSVMPGVACDPLSGSGYYSGDVVTLNASPAVNLISWGGACTGSSSTCIVTMDAAKTVTASFKDTPFISGLPAVLAFARQNVGSTSAAQSVTLTNSGTAALTIASIVASGDYGVTHNCGSGLGAGGFCTLNISFLPTDTGTRTGTVTITSDAPGSPHSIALSGSGQGAVASLSATSLNFATQGTGSTSAAQAVTLTNTGGAVVLNIASIVASGDFAITTTCGTTLAQAASCSINVTFTPTATGARSGSVVITSDAANSPNTITLSGTGVAVPVVTLSLMSLNFAVQNIGTSSTAQTIQLSNTGGAALNLSSIASSGDFAVTNNCGAGLAIGGSCNLSVTFVPTVAGAQSGAITITSNAQGSPHTVTLSGGSSAIATQTIVFGTAPNMLVGGTATVSATASSGLSVGFSSLTASICSVAGNTVSGIGAGTCTVAANQAGNSTYSAAPQVTQNITVTASASQLVNLSTRGQVQTGNNVMIGGFIIGGATPKKVLIRAVGPNLANYGVTGVLANPMLELHRSSDGSIIASNNDWGSASNTAEIQATGLAPVSPLESAILITLQPGAYTAIVSGADGGSGVGIVEVYDIDHPESPLINASTRGQVQTGSNVMIGGFIIQGTSNQTVLIRAVGPNLLNYGVTEILADPMLELHRSSDGAIIASNDNWQTASNAAAITATGLAPVSPLESAILMSLPPGAYTAIVSGSGGGTGVGIVEVYAQ